MSSSGDSYRNQAKIMLDEFYTPMNKSELTGPGYVDYLRAMEEKMMSISADTKNLEKIGHCYHRIKENGVIKAFNDFAKRISLGEIWYFKDAEKTMNILINVANEKKWDEDSIKKIKTNFNESLLSGLGKTDPEIKKCIYKIKKNNNYSEIESPGCSMLYNIYVSQYLIFNFLEKQGIDSVKIKKLQEKIDSSNNNWIKDIENYVIAEFDNFIGKIEKEEISIEDSYDVWGNIESLFRLPIFTDTGYDHGNICNKLFEINRRFIEIQRKRKSEKNDPVQ